jgi:hypothetical protein
MVSQNLEDCKFSLVHLSNDPIQLSQPSTSRQSVQDEAETSEHHIQSGSNLNLQPRSNLNLQPRSNLDLQQLPLTSLKSLQPDTKILVIILEAEAMFIEGHQVVFERCF